jgi:hypothetical protein
MPEAAASSLGVAPSEAAGSTTRDTRKGGGSTRLAIPAAAGHATPKKALTVQCIIGKERVGSYGRSLAALDIMQILFDIKEPGRELKAVLSRETF